MLNHLMGIQLIFTNNFGWEWHITLLVTSPSLCMHISALNTTVPIQFVMYQHVSNTKPIKPLLWSTHHNPQVRSQTPDIAANIMQAYSSGNKAFETFCHIQLKLWMLTRNTHYKIHGSLAPFRLQILHSPVIFCTYNRFFTMFIL